MNPHKFANAASSTISVTSTATNLSALIDVAGSTTNNIPPWVDTVILTPEDGNIRIAFQNNPTATQGFLVSQGNSFKISGQDFADTFLIRTGASDVTVSLYIGQDNNLT